MQTRSKTAAVTPAKPKEDPVLMATRRASVNLVEELNTLFKTPDGSAVTPSSIQDASRRSRHLGPVFALRTPAHVTPPPALVPGGVSTPTVPVPPGPPPALLSAGMTVGESASRVDALAQEVAALRMSMATLMQELTQQRAASAIQWANVTVPSPLSSVALTRVQALGLPALAVQSPASPVNLAAPQAQDEMARVLPAFANAMPQTPQQAAVTVTLAPTPNSPGGVGGGGAIVANPMNVGPNVKEEQSKSNKKSEDEKRSWRSGLKARPYSGDAHVDAYLIQFSATARSAGWPEEDWGARLVAALEGKARQILTVEPLPEPPPYERVASLLRARFASEASPELWRQYLENRRRGAKETVAELSQTILDATGKAYPSISLSDRRNLAVTFFTNALLDEGQRRHVRTHAPQTLEEAQRFALAFENASKTEDRRVAPQPRRVRAVGPPDAEEEQEQAAAAPSRRGRGQWSRGRGVARGGAVQREDPPLVRAVTELLSTIRAQQSSPGSLLTSARGAGQWRGRGRGRQNAGMAQSAVPQPTQANVGRGRGAAGQQRGRYPGPRPPAGQDGRSITCYVCGREGHVARDCQNAAPRAGGCYSCGQEGHFAPDCPSSSGNGEGPVPVEQAQGPRPSEQ